ncbi:hypothetical protein EYF80_032389 [Liparis tanakae]|uniref:Uncharacterized protein n=1 Tax=Liparis tanakae TaxID=230148 RepID=A0A4Z2GW12_9TELE|nr:hypothetical protein EYF80_032389 [Liparis tanakae]
MADPLVLFCTATHQVVLLLQPQQETGHTHMEPVGREGLLSSGAGSAVHNESDEMILQRAALSLQFPPLDIY